MAFAKHSELKWMINSRECAEILIEFSRSPRTFSSFTKEWVETYCQSCSWIKVDLGFMRSLAILVKGLIIEFHVLLDTLHSPRYHIKPK